MKNLRIYNELLFISFIAMITLSALFSFQKYFLNMDYYIFTETECDPSEKQCFVGYCDPEYEECSSIEEENVFYYEKIHKLANRVPLCDPEDTSCEAASCDPNDLKCIQIFCDQNSEEYECFPFISKDETGI